MPARDPHTQDGHSSGRRIRRRAFVKAAGASGIAVGVAGCVGMSNLTGSGGPEKIPDEKPSGDVTLQIAADSNFKKSQDAIQKALQEKGGLPKNISIQVQAGSFTTGDRQAKYQQLLNAGQKTPTVLMTDNGWTIPFIARNQIQNLSATVPSSITDRVESDYLDTMVATAKGKEDDLYGIPLFADFPTIQYRKDLLRKAGYSDSDFEKWATNPMKWSEFSEVVKKGMEATGKRGYHWQGKAYIGLACCDFVEYMGSWGGSYFGKYDNLFGPVNDRPVTVTEDPVVNAVRMMRTFIHGPDDPVALEGYKNISPPEVVSYTEEPSRKPFTKGKVVALRNWPYSIVMNAKEKNFGKDLGVMPVPYEVSASKSEYGPEIGGSTSALGGWHLTLNPNAEMKKKKAAVQLFKALQNDSVRLKLFEVGGWIPPIPDLIDSSKAEELDPIGRYVDTLKIASKNAVPRPVTPVWTAQVTKIAKAVNASLRQKKKPEKAMTDLKKTLKAIEKKA